MTPLPDRRTVIITSYDGSDDDGGVCGACGDDDGGVCGACGDASCDGGDIRGECDIHNHDDDANDDGACDDGADGIPSYGFWCNNHHHALVDVPPQQEAQIPKALRESKQF